jgi:hypothetical protein
MFSKKGSFFLIILTAAAAIGITVLAANAQNPLTDETININAGDININDAIPMLFGEPPTSANANTPIPSGATAHLPKNLPNLVNGFVGEMENQISRLVSGKVTAVDGATITIQADTKSAMVGLKVGDAVLLLPTPKEISANVGGQGSANMPLAGNINGADANQSILNGKVTATNGASFTVEDDKGANYGVNATNAKFYKVGNKNATIADVLVGDRVMVRGVINGTAVTASMVTDLAPPQNVVNQTQTGTKANGVKSFLGKIGDFFNNIFNNNK